MATLLKVGIDLLKYPTKPNVLRNSVMYLGGDLILDLTAATFSGLQYNLRRKLVNEDMIPLS